MNSPKISALHRVWENFYAELAKPQIADLLNYLVPRGAQPKTGTKPSFKFDILEFGGKTGNFAQAFWNEVGHESGRYEIFEPDPDFNLTLTQLIRKGKLNGLVAHQTLPRKTKYDLVLCAQGPWKVSTYSGTPILWLQSDRTNLPEFQSQITTLADCGTIIAIDTWSEANRGQRQVSFEGNVLRQGIVKGEHTIAQFSSSGQRHFDPAHRIVETVTVRGSGTQPLASKTQVWDATPLFEALRDTNVEVVNFADHQMHSKQFLTLAKRW